MGPESTQILPAKRGLISSAMTWDILLLLPASSPLAALITSVDFVRWLSTTAMFCRIVVEGTASITATASFIASAIWLVMWIDSRSVTSGKRLGSGPFFFRPAASFSVRAHSHTSTSLPESNMPSVIPQLVVPTIATFCIS